MNDSSAKTSSTAAKIKQAAVIATLNNELKHINSTLGELKNRPTPPHTCSQEERITEAEKIQAGLTTRWRITGATITVLAGLLTAFALSTYQACSGFSTSIAEARTVNTSQNASIKRVEDSLDGIEETQQQVLGEVNEMRGEVRALSNQIRTTQQPSAPAPSRRRRSQ